MLMFSISRERVDDADDAFPGAMDTIDDLKEKPRDKVEWKDGSEDDGEVGNFDDEDDAINVYSDEL